MTGLEAIYATEVSRLFGRLQALRIQATREGNEILLRRIATHAGVLEEAAFNNLIALGDGVREADPGEHT